MEPKESVVGGEADIPSDNQNRPLLTHFGLFSQPKSSVYDRQIYVRSDCLLLEQVVGDPVASLPDGRSRLG